MLPGKGDTYGQINPLVEILFRRLVGGECYKREKKKIDIEQFRVGIKFLLNFDCHIIILEF